MFEGETATGWDRRRAATRREILTAAWELAREQGVAGLQMRALASRVGLRAPSLYSYFPSKDAIHDAMFAEGQLQLRDAMAELPDRPSDRATLATGARRFFEFCTEDTARYQLMFQRVVPGFEPSPDSYALAVANLERFREQLAALGVKENRHVDLWTAMITGLTAQQISNDPGGHRWARLLEELVDLFCEHVGIPA